VVEKAVLDTSVIISGLVGSGSSNEVLRRVLTGRLRIILSTEIFKEYLKAVHYPRLRIPTTSDTSQSSAGMWLRG